MGGKVASETNLLALFPLHSASSSCRLLHAEVHAVSAVNAMNACTCRHSNLLGIHGSQADALYFANFPIYGTIIAGWRTIKL